MSNFDQSQPHLDPNTVTKTANLIKECLIFSGVRASEENVILLAYLLLEASKESNSITFHEIADGALPLEDDLLCVILQTLSETVWEKASSELHDYDPDVLRAIILNPSLIDGLQIDRLANQTTPDSLIQLANAILDIEAGALVADIGCGIGTYIINTAPNHPDSTFYGYEINSTSKVIAMIRAKMVGEFAHIIQCDAFSLMEEEMQELLPKDKFDAIFSNYPFGMRTRFFIDTPGVQILTKRFPGLTKATSADWLFHALICELLSENGKAVCVTTNGSTWNTIDKEIRAQFIEQGLLEAVIALPERLFPTTNISTSIIVLSHGNKSVRLVDATTLYTRGRRLNTLDAEHNNTIVSALSANTEFSREISLEELRTNDYVINPGRYLGETITFDNGVAFGTIIKSITRGAPYTASQLDQLVSHTPTDLQYLMLANIQNGIIDSNLPYLTRIEDRFEKYCVHTGTLILSKNGFPYKVAVATVEDGRKVLANGNLYIVELNTEMVDPYYIKAFLESEQGIAQLSSITVGATLPNIGVDQLKRMIIPLPPLEKQKRIASAYLAAQDEVLVLKRRLDKAQDRLTHIFDTESEE